MEKGGTGRGKRREFEISEHSDSGYRVDGDRVDVQHQQFVKNFIELEMMQEGRKENEIDQGQRYIKSITLAEDENIRRSFASYICTRIWINCSFWVV